MKIRKGSFIEKDKTGEWSVWHHTTSAELIIDGVLSTERIPTLPISKVQGLQNLLNNTVNLSGNQTIKGEKTFNDSLILPGRFNSIQLGNKNNWFWTEFTGENWTFHNTYTAGGWARNLMEMKNAEGTAYFRIGAQGGGQSFSHMYIGPAYNNYWLSLNNDRVLFAAKPQYAGNPTSSNDLTRKAYVDSEISKAVGDIESALDAILGY